ncbi:MAG: hypothetical protein R2744_03930 [Bacteroidales bacterium]
MKRSGYKAIIGLFVVQAIFLMSSTLYGVEVNKKYNKEFSSKEKTQLAIDNRYGDITVESWNESRVVIDVLVTVEYGDQAKAEKFLEMINVEFSDEGGVIGAKTVIDSKFSFGGWRDGQKFTIDYVVKMPVSLNFNVINRYGSVDIDELSGQVDVTVKYGSLFIEKLSRGKEKPLNKIALAYSSGELVEMGWTELYLRYSSRTTIGRARALMVDSRYSKLQIEKVGSIVLDSKYDNINITGLNNIVAESGYTSYNLGTVTGKLDIDAGYGSIGVERLAAGFESVNIASRYCSTKINVDDDASFVLDGSVQYGGIGFNEERAEIMTRIYESNSKTIKAVIGDKNTTSKIDFRSSYGSFKVF